MNNWYKTAKVVQASITFYPAGSDKIAKPMGVGEISFELMRFIKLPGVHAGHNDIMTDGDDFFKALGIINFYENKKSGLTPPIVQNIVADYNQFKAGIVVLKIQKREISKMYNCPVVRVEVVLNHTLDYPEIPEINVSNNSAYQFLTYLKDQGLRVDPEEPNGALSADELKFILSDNRPPSPSSYSNLESPSSIAIQNELGESGATWVNAAKPIDERFQKYIERFKQMIDYIDKYQLPNRTILYN